LSPRSREVVDHARTNLGGGAAVARRASKVPTTRGACLLPLAPLPCRTREREGSRRSRSTCRWRGLRWLGRPRCGVAVAVAVAATPSYTE
jgi:hypothetical protein